MAPQMRLTLNTRPGLRKRGLREAGINISLRRAAADTIADLPVDAVLRVLVARPQRVGVTGKGSVHDALIGAAAVAAEAVRWVEQDRRAEGARVELLLPVSGGRGGVSLCWTRGLGEVGEGLRLVARVVALVAEGAFVGVHHHAVEGEECALERVREHVRSNSLGYSSPTTKCVLYAWSWWMACSSSNLVRAPGRPRCAGFSMRHSSALMYSCFSSLLNVCLRDS